MCYFKNVNLQLTDLLLRMWYFSCELGVHLGGAWLEIKTCVGQTHGTGEVKKSFFLNYCVRQWNTEQRSCESTAGSGATEEDERIAKCGTADRTRPKVVAGNAHVIVFLAKKICFMAYTQFPGDSLENHVNKLFKEYFEGVNYRAVSSH